MMMAIALISLAGPVSAQTGETDDERARSHFLAGRSYFEQRRYNEAAEQFYDAYRLSGRTDLLINVATSYERAQQPDRAADMLEEYLGTLSDDDGNRRTLTIRMEELRAIAARDREAAEKAAAEKAALEEAARETALARVSDEPPSTSPLRLPGFITLGAGGALGVGALITGLMAESRYRSLEDNCDGTRCSLELEGDASSGRTLAIASTVLTGVGVAAIVTGAVLVIVGSKRSRDREEPTTEAGFFIDAGPGQIGLSGGVRF